MKTPDGLSSLPGDNVLFAACQLTDKGLRDADLGGNLTLSETSAKQVIDRAFPVHAQHYRCSDFPVNRQSDLSSQSLMQTQCMEAIGKRLERARKLRGLNQTDLGKVAGFSQGHVSDLESGRKEAAEINVTAFMAICRELAVTPEFLYYGAGENSERFDLEQALLTSFRSLAADQQPIAVSVIRAMLPAEQMRQNDTGSSTDDQSLMTPPNSDSGGLTDTGPNRESKKRRHGKNNSVQLQELNKRTRKTKPNT